MTRTEIRSQIELYRRLASAKYLNDELRSRYLAVAVSLEWQLSQKWRLDAPFQLPADYAPKPIDKLEAEARLALSQTGGDVPL